MSDEPDSPVDVSGEWSLSDTIDDPIAELLSALLAIAAGLGLGAIVGAIGGGLGAWALERAGLPPWAIAVSLGALPAAVAERSIHDAPSRGRALRSAFVGASAAALTVAAAPATLEIVGVVACAIAGGLAGSAIAVTIVDDDGHTAARS
ncbi:MAG: hypothetical protein IT379_40890 [Deltaproteobacteria bacterium]|nr:hypothetical protein [Deltaproteobacteria bacterium]